MSHLSICDEIGRQETAFSDPVFDQLPAAETNDRRLASWIADLQAFTQEPESEVQVAEADTVDSIAATNMTVLQRLAVSPWRSAGGYLDYSGWAARDRFRQLDEAITCTAVPRLNSGGRRSIDLSTRSAA